jgi:hypothetical protein
MNQETVFAALPQFFEKLDWEAINQISDSERHWYRVARQEPVRASRQASAPPFIPTSQTLDTAAIQASPLSPPVARPDNNRLDSQLFTPTRLLNAEPRDLPTVPPLEPLSSSSTASSQSTASIALSVSHEASGGIGLPDLETEWAITSPLTPLTPFSPAPWLQSTPNPDTPRSTVASDWDSAEPDHGIISHLLPRQDDEEPGMLGIRLSDISPGLTSGRKRRNLKAGAEKVEGRSPNTDLDTPARSKKRAKQRNPDSDYASDSDTIKPPKKLKLRSTKAREPVNRPASSGAQVLVLDNAYVREHGGSTDPIDVDVLFVSGFNPSKSWMLTQALGIPMSSKQRQASRSQWPATSLCEHPFVASVYCAYLEIGLPCIVFDRGLLSHG